MVYKLLFLIVLLLFPYILNACNVNVCGNIGDTCSKDTCEFGLKCNAYSNGICQKYDKCEQIEIKSPIDIKNDTCDDNSFCINGYCIPIERTIPRGSICKVTSNCNTGISCIGNLCSSILKDNCSIDSNCYPNQYCLISNGIGTCTERLKLNSTCSQDRDCEISTICINSKCSNLFSGNLNDTCFLNYEIPFQCNIGLRCLKSNESINEFKCLNYTVKTCDNGIKDCDLLGRYDECICGNSTTTITTTPTSTCTPLNDLSSQECKNSIFELNNCAKLNNLIPSRSDYNTLVKCGNHLCNYDKFCTNRVITESCGAHNTISFLTCPRNSSIYPPSSSSGSDSSSFDSSSLELSSSLSTSQPSTGSSQSTLPQPSTSTSSSESMEPSSTVKQQIPFIYFNGFITIMTIYFIYK